jgi:uncharacterized protein (DUF736 family)
MQYDNNLTGALFKNDRKESETHPDYKGSCEINGTEYWISSWLNESAKGKKYLSLKFQPKEGQQRQSAVAQSTEDDYLDL